MLHKYNTAEGVTAFSTTRKGGVSTGSYASFNANHYCGDDPDNVRRNRELLCAELGVGEGRLIVPHQTHKTVTRIIDEEFLALSAEEQKEALEGVDAVCTNLKDVCICVSTADCIPVLLYDETSGVISAVHAGWRGTVARIVEENIRVMENTYGIEAKNLKAIIGPGISLDAFEVGDEVFKDPLWALPISFSNYARKRFAITPVEGEKLRAVDERWEAVCKRFPSKCDRGWRWHIDLPLCNKLQLMNMGVKEENIFMSGICTYNNSEEFFSARKLGINSGRILNGIILK